MFLFICGTSSSCAQIFLAASESIRDKVFRGMPVQQVNYWWCSVWTYILRSFAALLAALATLATLPVRRLGPERRHVVVALLCVPLLSALFAAEAEAVVFGFPLGVGAGETTEERSLGFSFDDVIIADRKPKLRPIRTPSV